jgi:2-dehydro-3-deoxyglucarate aldolase
MKTLKEKLRNHQLAIGSWITLAHPAIAEIMARAGFGWLAVDLEHSVITIREAEELIRVIDLCGVTPLVRLTANNPDLIKRVMDAGAHGIIVPMVNSAAQAAAAVAAVYYPPRGTRGVGLARAQGYGDKFNEYIAWLETEAVVIIQIEHIEAVNQLEAIFAVAGIDGYLIGPYDLSGSLGFPGKFDHPLYLAAMDKIGETARRHQQTGGVHVVEPDPEQAQKFIAEGFRFLAYSVDTRMLDVSCRRGLERLRPVRDE